MAVYIFSLIENLVLNITTPVYKYQICVKIYYLNKYDKLLSKTIQSNIGLKTGKRRNL